MRQACWGVWQMCLTCLFPKPSSVVKPPGPNVERASPVKQHHRSVTIFNDSTGPELATHEATASGGAGIRRRPWLQPLVVDRES